MQVAPSKMFPKVADFGLSKINHSNQSNDDGESMFKDDKCKNYILRAENDDNDLNDDDLKFYVVRSFIKGTNIFPTNVDLGLKYLQKSCEKLNVGAIKSNSKTLCEGILVEINDEKAIYLLNEISNIYHHSIPKLKLDKTILSNESFDVNLSAPININYVLAKKVCKKASEMLNKNTMVKYGKLCMHEKKNKFGEIINLHRIKEIQKR